MRVGIYVHIPFCTVRCDYCAFHSITGWSRGDQRRLVDKVLADAACFAAAGYAASTIYVGGGTPSTLLPQELARLLDGLADVFGAAGEVTCEANPESATGAWLAAAARAGVSRVSVGVQTMNSALGATLGRRTTSPATLRRVRRQWPGTLSADLIIGIPGQSMPDVQSDVQDLAGLPVDHLSIYDLSVEEGTPLARRARQHALDDTEIDWQRVRALVASLGFARYEVSNFARPGCESLHNLGYWRGQPFVGLGPSAVSTLPAPGGAVRLRQPTDHAKYLAGHPVRDAARDDLGPAALALETLMLGLRTAEGVDRARFAGRFGRDVAEACGPALEQLERDGLLAITPRRVLPTDRGLDLHNRVMERIADCLEVQP